MVIFIRRTWSIRFGPRGIEILMAGAEDYERPIVNELVELIERSDPYQAGEIAHLSSGVVLADLLWDQNGTDERLVFLRRFIPPTGNRIYEHVTIIPVAWLLDAAAIAARLLMRLVAKPSNRQSQVATAVFTTDDRQLDLVRRHISDPAPEVINLRVEAMTRTGRGGLRRELASAWTNTSEMRLSQRVGFTRLRFEAAELADLVDRLVNRGMRSAYFADITGHRARLMARLCTEAGVSVTVIQHGRAANPCKYVPPEGVRFIAYSEVDLERLSGLMSDPSGIKWEVAPRRQLAPRREGRGVLVCPSLIVSSERFNEMKRHITELRSRYALVGIRFHPAERWPRIKARRLGATYVKSRVNLGELDDEWGRATVPHPASSVSDDLEEAGFEIVSISRLAATNDPSVSSE